MIHQDDPAELTEADIIETIRLLDEEEDPHDRPTPVYDYTYGGSVL